MSIQSRLCLAAIPPVPPCAVRPIPAFYGFAVPAVVAPMIAPAFLAQGGFLLGGIGAVAHGLHRHACTAGARKSSADNQEFRIEVEQTACNDDLQTPNRRLEERGCRARDRRDCAGERSREIWLDRRSHAQDPMIICDCNNDVVCWNPAAERAFGSRGGWIMWAQRARAAGAQAVP